MSLFSSHGSGTTIADIGIAHQDSMVLALTLEIGQPVETGRRPIEWAELAGIYQHASADYRRPLGQVWRWEQLLLVRWHPTPAPVAATAPWSGAPGLCLPEDRRETLRLIARCPNHRALVARLVAQFPGRKRAAVRKAR